MENLLQICDYGIKTKTWTTGLKSYTQTNCSATLTDKGYRIYRAPNLTTADNGNTMWGGLTLYPNLISENILQKNHSYILKFHVSGQTTAQPEFYWSNNIGWGGGGLNPTPTEIAKHNISANFQGEDDFFFHWTIKDDIYKTCTTSYSRFVAGNSYLSYAGFKFGFNYGSTGTLGTDLYITNLRLYDVTNASEIDISKQGVINLGALYEYSDQVQFHKDGEIYANNFYEI